MPSDETHIQTLEVTQVVPLGSKVALVVCRGDTLEIITDANLVLGTKSNLTLSIGGDFELDVGGKFSLVAKEDIALDAVNGSTPKKIFLNSRMAAQIKDLPSSVAQRKEWEDKKEKAFEDQNKAEHLDFSREELVELKKLLQERMKGTSNAGNL